VHLVPAQQEAAVGGGGSWWRFTMNNIGEEWKANVPASCFATEVGGSRGEGGARLEWEGDESGEEGCMKTKKHDAVQGERKCQCGGLGTHLRSRGAAAAAAISVRNLVERAGYSRTEASDIGHLAREMRCGLCGPGLRPSAHEDAADWEKVALSKMRGIRV
jgi:hypothetical protein